MVQLLVLTLLAYSLSALLPLQEVFCEEIENSESIATNCEKFDGFCSNCLDAEDCMYVEATLNADSKEVAYKCLTQDDEKQINSTKMEGYFSGSKISELKIVQDSKDCPSELENVPANDTPTHDDGNTTIPDSNSTSTTIAPNSTSTTIAPNSTTTTLAPNSTTTTLAPNSTTTTLAPNSTTTTLAPNSTTATIAPPGNLTTPAPPKPRGSSFDGWSFFGGILLAFGLIAIAWVSRKYYKSRSATGSRGQGNGYDRF